MMVLVRTDDESVIIVQPKAAILADAIAGSVGKRPRLEMAGEVVLVRLTTSL